MAELVVAGKLATRQYQRAAKCAQFLEAERLVRRGTVLPLVPADYEAVVEKLGKEFDDKEAARHKGNVFCYLSSPRFRYLGDVGDLLKWAAGEFGYEDRSHDIIYDRLGKKAMRAYAAKSGHSFVYLDVGIGGESEGRVTLELFDNKAPVTCENFKQLLKGVSNVESGESWGYKGTPFHRVRKGGWIQGGDVVDGSGANGKSAAPDGAPLNDETFTVCFDKPGILAMANTGPNTSASQFFLTMRALPWMDTTKVAFGRVIDGFRTLRIVERIETQNERPVVDVTIDQCGLLEY